NLGKGSLSVRVMEGIEKWSIARADAVVTVNLACKRIFASRSCRDDKIRVVMNTPDAQIFPFRAVPSKVFKDTVHPNSFALMYHGSLVERNGLDLAVDALEVVRKKIPSIQLRIYGHSTPFLEQVLESVRKKNMGQNVQYLGPKRLEDLVSEIQKCDL